ncbi:hypothetical protein CEY12_19530 [Chryseobacterium sp. T16E-39]|uniref:hypothetical protein n=1 Tax=Chryseobacterium sp. T16E-39 TaxID=2015076 RepID=UPI000B5B22A1|nr:hypothetical protein [Chryseobacterium sp. T16E-39]ASK32834.1 hypothetical protein CEY12_19530 [Chryseobacterium sp. T16E-39]
MKVNRNKYLLLNYVFVVCLFILFLNDHFFKYEFSNFLTGKLSDIVGIIILPLLLTYIFPKLKVHSLWVSALLFLFWKSSYSEGFINLYNQYALIPITRVIDYSDLVVFLLLPIPYYIIKNVENWNSIKVMHFHPLFVFIPSLFTLMATSPPPSFNYTRTKGNLHCFKCNITVNYSQEEIVRKLRNNNIVFDTIFPMNEKVLERNPYFRKNNIYFYKINQLVIDQDTLRNLDFAMRSIDRNKTKFYFNGMQVNENVSTAKLMRKARKHYRKMIFKELKTSLKN